MFKEQYNKSMGTVEPSEELIAKTRLLLNTPQKRSHSNLWRYVVNISAACILIAGTFIAYKQLSPNLANDMSTGMPDGGSENQKAATAYPEQKFDDGEQLSEDISAEYLTFGGVPVNGNVASELEKGIEFLEMSTVNYIDTLSFTRSANATNYDISYLNYTQAIDVIRENFHEYNAYVPNDLYSTNAIEMHVKYGAKDEIQSRTLYFTYQPQIFKSTVAEPTERLLEVRVTEGEVYETDLFSTGYTASLIGEIPIYFGYNQVINSTNNIQNLYVAEFTVDKLSYQILTRNIDFTEQLKIVQSFIPLQ